MVYISTGHLDKQYVATVTLRVCYNHSMKEKTFHVPQEKNEIIRFIGETTNVHRKLHLV